MISSLLSSQLPDCPIESSFPHFWKYLYGCLGCKESIWFVCLLLWCKTYHSRDKIQTNLYSHYSEWHRTLYGAQNEAYMSRSAEKWVKGLCFNELGVSGWNDGVKRSVYIGLHLVYFWGLLRLLWFTWGLLVVYIAFLLVVGVVLGWGRMVAEATFLCRFWNLIMRNYSI